MAYAVATDVEVELGRPAASVAEAAQWDAWLARVERGIARGFARAGYDMTTQVGIGEPTADDVADVEVAAVIRKIQNPTWGESSYTKSLDDGSITRRREGGAEVDPLALLDGEWSALLPVGTRVVRAFSVMPS